MIAATVTTPAMVDAIKAARAQHELIVSGAYAHCSCEVEFYFYDRSTQYQEHREERIANAAAAAALAAAEQRAEALSTVVANVRALADEWRKDSEVSEWNPLAELDAALSSRSPDMDGNHISIPGPVHPDTERSET